MAHPSRNLPHSHSLRPPQFTLRTLLGLVAAVSVLLALRQWISPLALFALAFLAASVFLHVAGNAIGTRLRQIGDLPQTPLDTPPGIARRAPEPHDFAPATPLSHRASLGWMIIAASSIGATTGAIGGGFWTFLAAHGQAGPLNIAVGVVAFAILGGMAAFATFAFAQVLGTAIWQATAASSIRPDAERTITRRTDS